jgi:hypothetical protein
MNGKNGREVEEIRPHVFLSPDKLCMVNHPKIAQYYLGLIASL